LVRFAGDLLARAGMDPAQSQVVAEILVEADLMGHDTHGLNLLPSYLEELQGGTMTGTGDPEILRDRGAISQWDGKWLSGVSLTARAVEFAVARAEQLGIAIVSVGRAHHTACLQAYLQRATDHGFMVIIASSDPASATVAPFGGLDPVLGPNPIAIGIPTRTDPILIDISSSITTNGQAARATAEGRELGGKWLQDAYGAATADPKALKTDPPGTLLLAGGQDHGQKGYGLALMVDALTHGLSGHGRRAEVKRWSASVFVQVIAPEAFSGADPFLAEADYLVARCHASRPYPGLPAVRLPGEKALARKRAALVDGVELYPGVLGRLRDVARRLDVGVPFTQR
jgi:LDH2 family malate/lactate/ureidoglycolate dehydrogenase